MPDVGGSNFLRPSNWSPVASPNNSQIRVGPLPAPVSWARLLLGQALALLPALAVLALTLAASYAARDACDLRLLYPDAETEVCASVLTPRVMALFLALGAMSWHTAYALRPACWEATFLVTKALVVLPHDWLFPSALFDESVMILTGLASALLRSVVVEGLRLLGQVLCVVTVVALAWQRHNAALVRAAAPADEAACQVGPDDPRFVVALWLGAGWAAAELVAGSYQLGKFLPLYRSVERTPRLDEEDLLTDYVHADADADADADTDAASSSYSSSSTEEMPIDELILVREKAELEEQLGEFLENVSPATIALWRLDSVLWDIGCTLILSASLTLAEGCLGDAPTPGGTYTFLALPPLATMGPTLLVLVALRTVATTVWMVLIPRLGLISITYTTMLVGLALLSAGLGRWGALA
ncbi:hypothetical protein MBRA1_003887 [Malassezia brasiliensis]|uniref:Transmembrane protein n=1 Tax=Malassezia brasiliensis TaxID=1821822 RepID=A0AAF0DWR1_9BASI|nr:hypothetical protein MBRA1_003887 [Malassezia brasiliensis]